MIGDSIKKYRNDKKISQRSLAKSSGVSFAYIQQLEKGLKKNPSLDVLNKIADALAISLDELLNNEKISFSSKLIVSILRMDYITIGCNNSQDEDLETISHHTDISVDDLKNCIEENKELKTEEQIKLIEFWNEFGCIDDGIEFEDFIHDNYKEISENPLISTKIKKLLYIDSEKNNTEKLIDLLEDHGYAIDMESSDGISTVTISDDSGTVSEILEGDFINFGNDLLETISRFTMFSIKEFLEKHNNPKNK